MTDVPWAGWHASFIARNMASSLSSLRIDVITQCWGTRRYFLYVSAVVQNDPAFSSICQELHGPGPCNSEDERRNGRYWNQGTNLVTSAVCHKVDHICQGTPASPSMIYIAQKQLRRFTRSVFAGLICN